MQADISWKLFVTDRPATDDHARQGCLYSYMHEPRAVLHDQMTHRRKCLEQKLLQLVSHLQRADPVRLKQDHCRQCGTFLDGENRDLLTYAQLRLIYRLSHALCGNVMVDCACVVQCHAIPFSLSYFLSQQILPRFLIMSNY